MRRQAGRQQLRNSGAHLGHHTGQLLRGLDISGAREARDLARPALSQVSQEGLRLCVARHGGAVRVVRCHDGGGVLFQGGVQGGRVVAVRELAGGQGVQAALSHVGGGVGPLPGKGSRGWGGHEGVRARAAAGCSSESQRRAELPTSCGWAALAATAPGPSPEPQPQ